MEKIANIIVCALGVGAMGGGLVGAALLVDRLLGVFAL